MKEFGGLQLSSDPDIIGEFSCTIDYMPMVLSQARLWILRNHELGCVVDYCINLLMVPSIDNLAKKVKVRKDQMRMEERRNKA